MAKGQPAALLRSPYSVLGGLSLRLAFRKETHMAGRNTVSPTRIVSLIPFFHYLVDLDMWMELLGWNTSQSGTLTQDMIFRVDYHLDR